MEAAISEGWKGVERPVQQNTTKERSKLEPGTLKNNVFAYYASWAVVSYTKECAIDAVV